MIDVELDRLVKRAKAYIDLIDINLDPQITTLLHRYICVLLSANIDKAIHAILTEFARIHGSAEILRFVSKRYQRGTNYSAEKTVQTLNSFHPEWGARFATLVEAGRLKEQLDSLYGLRNSISHGEQVTVSRPSLDGYFDAHSKIIAILRQIVLA
jgi:hypothetical protein